jgi:hypothetical protein
MTPEMYKIHARADQQAFMTVRVRFGIVCEELQIQGRSSEGRRP